MRKKLRFSFLLIPFLISCVHKIENDANIYSQSQNQNLNRDLSRAPSATDNNGTTYLDPSLEVLQPDEEIKMQAVAKVVAEFNKTQQSIRTQMISQSNKKEKEQQIIDDLPPNQNNPKQGYATRDVHRKTHGCYVGQLELNSEDQLLTNLNEQIVNIEKDRQNSNYKEHDLFEKNNQYFKFGAVPKILKDLSELGVFGGDQTKDVVVRFSNGAPSNSEDKEPDARGMALKILPKGFINKPVADFNNAQEINDKTLLDILTINFPTFMVNDPVKYFKLNELFLKSKEDDRDKLSALIYQIQSLSKSGMTNQEIDRAYLINGSIIENPLFQTYHSMVASRLGTENQGRAIKYIFAPVACSQEKKSQFEKDQKLEWPDWSNQRGYAQLFGGKGSTPPHGQKYARNYLRDKLAAQFKKEDFCFELQAQLYRDQKNTNIEDSLDFWPSSEEDKVWWEKQLNNMKGFLAKFFGKDTYHENEIKWVKNKKLAPLVTIGKIRLTKENNQNASQNTAICEDLSFSPWNGEKIEYHQPLGLVSRMKRRVYNASRFTRHCLNGVDTAHCDSK